MPSAQQGSASYVLVVSVALQTQHTKVARGSPTYGHHWLQ